MSENSTLALHTVAQPSGFHLGTRSRNRLRGVHPDIRRVVKLAIQLTPIDFAVGEGLRSVDRQRDLYRRGATKTMNSYHLTGDAVDLHALHPDTGKVTWDWKYYYPIAEAMAKAATTLGIPIKWGGAWRQLSDTETPWEQQQEYKADGGRFLDGPHYQRYRT